MRERAKYIPMRLSIKERKLLRLLEAALSVSEYVDRVDVISFKSRSGRMVSMIKEVCSILCGLLVSSDYKEGQRLIENKNYADNEEFFQKIFEVGRRHKIMNPEKMRSTYGKLIYMLQDAESPEVSEVLGFKCVKEIRTVFSFLQYAGAVELLNDPLVQLATSEIRSENRSREQVNADIRHKEKAVEHLARKYRSEKLEEEDIRCCLYSIGDNNAFLRFTRDPCEKMLEWLRSKFNPELPEDDFSLAIIGGRNGARLTHSHSRQYRFVEQSLMLWSAILKDMFKLWHLSEQDLLSSLHPYKLRDTGQGLNRVQHSPRIGSEMERILHSVQSKLQSKWEGSSVVHLGDHNVPNALMFIDKYTQVERILNPVVLCIEKLPQLYASDKGIRKYLDSSFGSVEHLSKMILSDFFRSAFDGSGADNFFDAGSCIDGRLTSAWNWCSRIERKPYFPAFLLTGFTGFDGKFE
ncbi:hypothetical protein GUITHDRAFT_75421 [Guillardia theta CCMP2712]|uniref:Non-canonical E2 ubiquitin-conjugating enzyme C-terminal domain-containing protein n=2 Tax=Guillardia theta TaxID=55529 RepID=L1IXB1_GUITC|nr:hypothetical protein GUITHDRAFT_75421 [Guillardia theta CCMP2712]EKX40524.1 hypothetical protein GUITHDRAFT_75421 [Guillardia theta CCMP2712]|eukprot:XP_005827504.1 hypothetical protein GUITHDRAFT_75421 [Guillardia theta CCMP2712]